jgi:putative peptidoglycan lipid II flippase
VVVSALAGAALMMVADRLPVGALPWPVEESPLRLGAVGLAVGSSLGAWLELVLLRGELRRLRPELVGRIDAEAGLYGRLLGLAAVALAPPALLAWATPELWPAARGALVVGCYALAYLGLGKVSGMLEPGDLLRGFESAAGPDPRQDR